MYEEGFLKVVDRSSLDTDLGKMTIDFILDSDLVFISAMCWPSSTLMVGMGERYR